jgi:hypothetical protein
MTTGDTVAILDGETSVVSDRRGDIDISAEGPHGLFYRDTRHLSRWRLTIAGRTGIFLPTDDAGDSGAEFILVPPQGTGCDEPAFSIVRGRTVRDGFHEDITVRNHTAASLELELRVDAAADFSSLLELSSVHAKKGRSYEIVEHGRLVLGDSRNGSVRETWITSSGSDALITEDGLRFPVHVDPHGEWTTCLDVFVGVHRLARGRGGALCRPGTTRRGRGAQSHTSLPSLRFVLDDA